jgi:hypothetical protein
MSPPAAAGVMPPPAELAPTQVPSPREATALGGEPAVQPPMTAAQRRKAAREADVALLAAMIEHVSANSRKEVNGAMPELRLPGGKGRGLTTIAQIVEHCRTLEGEEAKICKVRICENYWGKDDACSTRPDFHRPDQH